MLYDIPFMLTRLNLTYNACDTNWCSTNSASFDFEQLYGKELELMLNQHLRQSIFWPSKKFTWLLVVDLRQIVTFCCKRSDLP